MNSSQTPQGFGSATLLRVSHTDLVRAIAITSITISIIGITYLSMAAGYGAIVPQLFYFPILYTTYFYPSRGLYIAGCCAAAYLIIAGLFIKPDIAGFGGVVMQAVMFIGIAAGSAWVLDYRQARSFSILAPEKDVSDIQAMIAGGENDHVEFKLLTLWSVEMTKEQLAASESPEVHKYRTNASRFIIARSIAGFLNTDGGDLVIGIREDRMLNTITVPGIEADYEKMHVEDRNTDGYRRMLIDSVIRKYLPEIFEMASRYISISFPVISKKTVCHLRITPSPRPIFVDSGSEEIFFIRVDASTRGLSGRAMTRYILNRFS
jgi:hypothetical protein